MTPPRWGRWAAPCPVGHAETIQGKVAPHRKSRVVLSTPRAAPGPARPGPLRRPAARRRPGTAAVRPRCQPRQRHRRSRCGPGPFRHQDHRRQRLGGNPATGKRRNLSAEEDRAFWAWATIEVLRATGIRAEELVQLSHHSFVQYRLPGTGELVPLLQIVPSTSPSGSWSSAPSSPTYSAPSSPGSAAPATPSRSSPPTTTTSGSGCRPPRCCSSGASAPRTARSPPPPSARSSPPPWPAPA